MVADVGPRCGCAVSGFPLLIRSAAGEERAGAAGCGPRGRRRSSAGRGQARSRSCGRAGSGRRPCHWTTPIPSAGRTCRRR
jgi:hypothetical protein